MSGVAFDEAQMRHDVEVLCETNRRKKNLEEEARDLAASILQRLTDAQVQGWEDARYAAQIVEVEGRKTADVKALEAAGLEKFVKVGDPSRHVKARRK